MSKAKQASTPANGEAQKNSALIKECLTCGAIVAAIEHSCPSCGSADWTRKQEHNDNG